MRQGRWERLAPLTGVVFFLLVVAAILVSGGETPDAHAPVREIASYYKDSADQTMVADLLGVIAGVFLVWFAASLRGVIWRAEGGEGRLATLTFAGGVLAAVGAWTVFGIDFAVADASDDVSAAVLKPLVALNNSFFLPLAGGLGLLMVASAFATCIPGPCPWSRAGSRS